MSLLRRHRDFRLLWIGETVSRFGSATSTVALPLIAISMLEATTFQVGLLTAAAWAPWLLIGLPAGAWIDRRHRRPILLATSAASFLLTAALPFAAWTGFLTIHLLLTAALLVGAAAVLFQTAYTAYLPTLLDRADHAEGNAKLHGSASAAQLAGLGCGGLLVQFAGPANALLVDAATFLIALACLAAIQYRERRTTDACRAGGGIKTGIALVAKDVWLRTLTMFGAVSNLALMGYQAIVVVFLVREAGLSPGTVGALIAAATSGGILGAFAGRRLAARFGTALTSADVIAAIRQLALLASDDLIAGILNRNGLRTGHGNRWTRERVTSLRSHHRIPVFKPAADGVEPWLNLSDAAKLLKVAPKTLRLAAEAGEVEASHPLPDGPWIFARCALATEAARSVTERARQNSRYPAGSHPAQQNLFSSMT